MSATALEPVARDSVEDASLVQRFNDGDESAFVEIIARHWDRIFRVACHLMRNGADAEEMTQDTFIGAYHGLGRFRGDCGLSTWLHRILQNHAHKRYWYFFLPRRHATLWLDGAVGGESTHTYVDLIARDGPSPARKAEMAEFSPLLERCMAMLTNPHREVLTMRSVLNQSYEEMAESLGVEIGTVKSRIARARENLVVHLLAACPEFPPEAKPTDWFERRNPVAGLRALSGPEHAHRQPLPRS